MISNHENVTVYYSGHGIGRGPFTRAGANKHGLTACDHTDNLNDQNEGEHVGVDEGSNCDEQSYDDEQEAEVSSQSSEMGEVQQEKMPFSKLNRSPVRWSDLHT